MTFEEWFNEFGQEDQQNESDMQQAWEAGQDNLIMEIHEKLDNLQNQERH